jgi:hypothetical protein
MTEQTQMKTPIRLGKSVHHFRESNLADVEALERAAAQKVKTLADGSRQNVTDAIAGAVTLYDCLIVGLEGYDLKTPADLTDPARRAELLPLIPLRHKEAAVNELYDLRISVNADDAFSLFQKTIRLEIHRVGEAFIPFTFHRPTEAHYRKFADSTIVRRKDGRDTIVIVERQPRALVELFDDLQIDSWVTDAYVKCLAVQELFAAFDDAVVD